MLLMMMVTMMLMMMMTIRTTLIHLNAISSFYEPGRPSVPPPLTSLPLFPPPQPSTSSVTSDEKVDYVQVDKEKTQALQNTMQEWTDVRQSTEPAKGVKS